jgi:hypothetical protein
MKSESPEDGFCYVHSAGKIFFEISMPTKEEGGLRSTKINLKKVKILSERITNWESTVLPFTPFIKRCA